MQILILGGTVFLGRHLVEAALARGHTVTLFNRGQHNPELFPTVEKVHGDRAWDLGLLLERRWDAVIDTCGYVPRLVRLAASQLARQVEHYTFISSVSVYSDLEQPGLQEAAPAGVLADPTIETVNADTYGPLKALCESAAEQAMPGRVLVVRPGLIVGPWDPSDRFSYWPVRLARGGEVLAPGAPGEPVQFIDVRDLAAWLLDRVEHRQTGVYNATGPATPLTRQELLQACQAVAGTNAELTWVDDDFLLAEGVAPYSDLPLWVPAVYAGLDRVDIAKARAADLHFRPLTETIRDTLDWRQAHAALPWRAGLSAEREQELLALFRTR